MPNLYGAPRAVCAIVARYLTALTPSTELSTFLPTPSVMGRKKAPDASLGTGTGLEVGATKELTTTAVG